MSLDVESLPAIFFNPYEDKELDEDEDEEDEEVVLTGRRPSPSTNLTFRTRPLFLGGELFLILCTFPGARSDALLPSGVFPVTESGGRSFFFFFVVVAMSGSLFFSSLRAAASAFCLPVFVPPFFCPALALTCTSSLLLRYSGIVLGSLTCAVVSVVCKNTLGIMTGFGGL